MRSTASVVSNMTEAPAYWSRPKQIKTKASRNEEVFHSPRKSSGSVSCYTSGLSSTSTSNDNASTKSITSVTTDSSSTDYSLINKLRYKDKWGVVHYRDRILPEK